MSDPLEAHSRLSANEAAQVSPLFAHIHAYGFYDGPETGVAVAVDGTAYRFEDVGESRYRTYRAYVLVRLVGDLPNWVGSDEFFIDAEQWRAAVVVPSDEQYVAISDLWLKNFVVERLANGAELPASFDEAHHMLRSKFVSSDRPV
ncbi:MAG: hypothetical protein JSR86_01160 [Proteobacteria bacterium]|nr:hypothetical protein [Pseudomonadota bacterium]